MANTSFRKSLPKEWWSGGVLVVIVTALVVWLALYGDETATSAKSNRDLALTCTTDMATRFHIHSRLEIIVNGEKRDIPANIGVRPACMNSLHTHDDSGEIHIEAPEKRDFTLADFFAVWGKPFDKDHILDFIVDADHVLRMTVNGKETQEYENTILRDQDRIVISYEGKQ